VIRTIRKTLICSALLAIVGMATPALARDWYISGAATLSILRDPHTVIDNAPTPGATLFITDNLDHAGWGGQIAFGRRFGPVRAEIEGGRTRQDANQYTVTAPISNRLPQTGGDTITRLMANAYFDVPLHRTGIRPYVGAGIGEAWVDVTTKASRPFGPPTAPVQLIDDKVDGFAWQAMAGIAVPLSARVAITAQYRWFDAGTLHGLDTRGQPFRTSIAGSNVDLGIRFDF
jgi:opacity protein-like surface antigen